MGTEKGRGLSKGGLLISVPQKVTLAQSLHRSLRLVQVTCQMTLSREQWSCKVYSPSPLVTGKGCPCPTCIPRHLHPPCIYLKRGSRSLSSASGKDGVQAVRGESTQVAGVQK